MIQIVEVIKNIAPVGLCGLSEDKWLSIYEEKRNELIKHTHTDGRNSELAWQLVKSIQDVKRSLNDH